jgi:hypothetical protein
VAIQAQGDPVRLGLGLFVGAMSTVGGETGTESAGGLLRLRLNSSFDLEGEISRSRAQGEPTYDRAGLGLVWKIGSLSGLRPYVVGAVGGVEASGMTDARRGYAEAGVGLELKLTRSLRLAGDVRSGTMRLGQGDEPQAKTFGAPMLRDHDASYSRARIGALLYF